MEMRSRSAVLGGVTVGTRLTDSGADPATCFDSPSRCAIDRDTGRMWRLIDSYVPISLISIQRRGPPLFWELPPSGWHP